MRLQVRVLLLAQIRLILYKMGGVGFEPTKPDRVTDLQSAAFDHSAILLVKKNNL
jgi:hypothetical protein